MPFPFGNKTRYELESEALRITWAAVYILAFVSSLLGGVTILVASAGYRAFKFPRFIVVIIQHIAVCNIGISFALILPMIISLFANGWILGDHLCYITTYVTYYCNLLGVLFVGMLTTSKLIILKYPLQLWFRSTSNAHLLCLALWLFALNVPLTCAIVDSDAITFDYRIYTCYYSFTSSTWVSRIWLIHLLTVINIILPIVMVISSTIFLLVIARRVVKRNFKHERLKRQGIFTAVFTAVFCCVSYIPYSVFCVFVRFPPESEILLFRVAWSLILVNTVGCIYIYTVVVVSFREFMWITVLGLVYPDKKVLLEAQCSSSGRSSRKVSLQSSGRKFSTIYP